MIALGAPYNGPVTVSILPNPVLENKRAWDNTVLYRQATDGTIYTYVKRVDNQEILEYDFENVERLKILEIEAFIEEYINLNLLLINHHGEQWKVILQDNPTNFSIDKYTNCGASGRKENGSFRLTFIGEYISG